MVSDTHIHRVKRDRVRLTQRYRTGRRLLFEFRRNTGFVIPVLLLSRLKTEQLIHAAWDAYTSHCKLFDESPSTRPADIKKTALVLQKEFKVCVRRKKDTKPTEMPGIVKAIIGH